MDALYPPKCGICEKDNKNFLCLKCNEKLKKEFKLKRQDLEDKIEFNFVEHYYAFKYKDLIRKIILEIKFNKKVYLYNTLEKFLQNNQKYFEKLKKYDIIIVVPLSRKRLLMRGYNQSQLIGKTISGMLSIKIEKNVLYKIKNIAPQSSLNKTQRKNNVRGVYKAKNIDRLYNKKILLIDDIYTTGSTLNECAKTLTDFGIDKKNIGVFTLAKD